MKPSSRCLMSVVALAVVLPTASAGETPARAAEEKPSVEVVELTLHPAGAPRPALKYRLLPRPLEWTPGNAVPLYMKAFLMMQEISRGAIPQHEPYERLWDNHVNWLSTPLDQLPLEEVRKMLGLFDHALGEAELASRRMECDWGLPIREVENAYAILLPEMQAARDLGRIVALKARLEIAEGKWGQALGTLQTGYALARHVAEQRTLVSGLVGRAIADTMTGQLETLIQSSDAPNLYWSITALPHPVIDLQKGIDFEEIALHLVFPEFQEARRNQLTPEQWQSLLDDVLAKYTDIAAAAFDEKPAKTPTSKELVDEAYPTARREMIARGRSEEEVNAMSPPQVVLLHIVETYEESRDEAFKWFHVPYWQAREGVEAAQKEVEASGKREVIRLPGVLLSAVANTRVAAVGIERRIAALRCVEAIRLYAVRHDGKLPESLGDITEVPIPENPFTGKPFPYRLEGNTAVLEAGGPVKSHPRQYRLTLAE